MYIYRELLDLYTYQEILILRNLEWEVSLHDP